MGTPERKKKLRLLLRKKAAEELKKEQERKAAERRRIIEERCGQAKNLDDASEEEIVNLLNQFHQRICRLEFAKYDMEFEVRKKDFEVQIQNPPHRHSYFSLSLFSFFFYYLLFFYFFSFSS